MGQVIEWGGALGVDSVCKICVHQHHHGEAITLALPHPQVTCLILGVLRFDSTGFAYFTFSDSSTIWPRQGANLSNITIATPHGISGYRNSALTLSGEEGSEVGTRYH